MKLQQNVKFVDAQRVLLSNGFKLKRIKGSHYQYEKGTAMVVVPIKLNPCIWYRICKNNRLIV